MKLKNIFLVAISLLASISCSKEEALTATNPLSSAELIFPEVTPYDDITTAINEKFGVKIFWSDNITAAHVNRNWTTQTGSYNFGYLNEEQAEETLNFLNDYIFPKIDPKLFFKALKPNVFLLYDLNVPFFGALLAPTMSNYEGMDNWLFSFHGAGIAKYPMYPDDLHAVPTTEDEILSFRREMFMGMFKTLVTNKIITTPEIFSTDFSYSAKGLKYLPKDFEEPLFYMNTNVCGLINYSSGNLGYINNASQLNPTLNFISYIALVVRYSKEEMETTAGIAGVPYHKFPKILEYYDYVYQYFLRNYNYDLAQLHKL